MIDAKTARTVCALPRGSCYHGAYLMLEACPYRSCPNVRVCHGVCVLTDGSDKEFGHGWIEDACGDWVVCYDVLYPTTPIDREKYYRTGNVRQETVKRYNWFTARRLFREHGIYGPWDEVISAAAHRRR